MTRQLLAVQIVRRRAWRAGLLMALGAGVVLMVVAALTA